MQVEEKRNECQDHSKHQTSGCWCRNKIALGRVARSESDRILTGIIARSESERIYSIPLSLQQCCGAGGAEII